MKEFSVKILALDLATNAGFAMGNSGDKPTSWSKRLKSPEDDPERAFKKLGIELRDIFALDKPDLVIVEAPMSMGGMVRKDDESERGFKFTSNPNTIYMLTGLVGVVFGICGPYGIQARKANVQQVRKNFLGMARPPEPKRAVLDRCYQLGWLPRDCRDDNRADSLALWMFACGHYAGHLGVLAAAKEAAE